MKLIQIALAFALGCGVAYGDGSAQVATDVIALFDKHDLVALGVWHNSSHDATISMSVIRHPAFPKKVRNVVVECANSLYQDTLDRYIGGGEVPRSEVQKVWRDTTQSPVMDAASLRWCESFLTEVRSHNRVLPAGSRIRVVAGDPPIDWSKVHTPEEFSTFLQTRDESAVRVIEREVLAKGQRALVVYGAGHLWRNNALNPRPNIATSLDAKHPGKLFTVLRLSGPYPKLQSLLPTSSRPALVHFNAGPAAELDANEIVGRDIPVKLFGEGVGIGKVANAVIYTGQEADTPIASAAPAEQDAAWNAELTRRRALMPRLRR